MSPKLMGTPSASIIATSYNQLKTLSLLVASLRRQSESNFELIIADDGSSDGTRDFCSTVTDIPLLFVSQKDEGYRKARILNEALSQAKSDYLVFVDSDVILGKNFVEDHLLLRRPGSFVCGRRVELGPDITRNITTERIEKGDFDRLSWGLFWELLRSCRRKDSRNWKRALRVTQPWIRNIMGYGRPIDLLGSNMSMWKKDMLAINGFNEALESYWGEDGDLFIRLRNLSCKAVNGKGACIQYHLFHPRREPTKENIDRVNQLLLRKDYIWAEKGYSDRFNL